MKKNINLIVKSDEYNLRVDVFVNKREKLISRTRIKNLILKEQLKLNDKAIKSPAKKVVNGAPARSRTLNLQSRNLALYPVELRAHNVLIL